MKLPCQGNGQYPFTRILVAIIIANFTSLVILNLFELPAFNLVYVYLVTFLVSYQLTGYLCFRRRSTSIDKVSILMSSLLLILLTLPRVSYLLEWIPGNEVRVYADDHARLAELISMTLSESYPLAHPANRDYLLSFYYASLYPMAFLKFILPALTLKNTIFLGNFIYHILILGSLLELAHLLLRNKVSIRVFIFLCTLFSGLDWLTTDPFIFKGSFEWWQYNFFNGDAQISSYFTGMFWVIHHFVAFYALFLAYVLSFYTRARHRPLKIALVLLLLVSAFYSSPFSVLSAPLFALIHARTLWKSFIRSWAFTYVTVAALVPLFLFFGKLPAQGFKISTSHIAFTEIFWIDKLLTAPIYFVFVPIVEFIAIPFLLLLVIKQMHRVEKAYLAAATFYFCLVYIVAYSGWNNFAMRGMFLPTLVFFFLFARYSPAIVEQLRLYHFPDRLLKTVTLAMVILTLFGTLKMSATLLDTSLKKTLILYQMVDTARIFGISLPGELQVRYRDIIWNQEITAVQPSADERHQDYKYNMEKFMDALTIDEMVEWEKEILRLPRRGLID